MATHDAPFSLSTVIAGLGGRPITRKGIEAMLAAAESGDLGSLSFLDLDLGVVERERARMAADRRSGPSAENILADVRGSSRID